METGSVFKVFLSSSFLDMHEERDYLQNHAFKSINAWLRPQGYRLEVMDLRGSTLQAEEEMQRAEVAVLNSCLRRVTECRPRLLGLLGDRYGWVCYESAGVDQPFYIRETLQSMADQAGIPVEQTFDKSITQLEIEHGFRIMDKDKCFFYLREGIPYDSLSAAEREMYGAGKPLQDNLKRYVAQQYEGQALPEHVSSYEVGWDAVRHRIAGLEDFNRMVESDLRQSIEKELAEEPAPPVSFEKIYFDNKKSYTYEIPPLGRVRDFLRADDKPNVMLLRGEEGSGKSVLVSQLEGIGERKDMLSYVVGVHSQLGTAEEMLTYLYGALCEKNGTPNMYTDGWGMAQVRGAFEKQLADYCENADLALIIDGVDKLKEDGYASGLQWLPNELPRRCRVLLTSGPRYTQGRPSTEVMETQMPAVTRQYEMEKLLETMAARYSKTYDPEIKALAAEKAVKAGGNPLYARILNDYLMTMTAEEYSAFKSADAHLLWMRQEIENMPEDVEGIYMRVYDRARRAYGEEVTRAVMGFAALAFRGMTTFELMEMLDGIDVPYEQSTLLELRDFLEVHMVPTRDYDSWTPEHESFIRFIAQTYDMPYKEMLLAFILGAMMRGEDSGESVLEGTGEFIISCFHAGSTTSLNKYVKLFPPDVEEPPGLDNARMAVHHIINRYEEATAFICKAIADAPDVDYNLLFRFIFTDAIDPRSSNIPIESMIEILQKFIDTENKRLGALGRLIAGSRVRMATIANNLLLVCYSITKQDDKAQQAYESYKGKTKLSRQLKGQKGANTMTLIFKLNEAQAKEKSGDKIGAIEVLRDALDEITQSGYKFGNDPAFDSRAFDAYCSLAYKIHAEDPALAKKYLDTAEHMIEVTRDKSVVGSWKSVYHMGMMEYYDQVGDGEKALEHAEKSLELCVELASKKDKDFILLHNLAAYCSRARVLKNVPDDFRLKTTQEHVKARQKIAEGMGGQDSDIYKYAVAAYNLAAHHKRRKENEEAIKYFTIALENHEKVKNSTQVSAFGRVNSPGLTAYELASTPGYDPVLADENNEKAFEYLIRLPDYPEYTPSMENARVEKPAHFNAVVAMRHYNKADFVQAEAYFRKAYDKRQRIYEKLKTWTSAQGVAVVARDVANCMIEQGKQKGEPELAEYRRRSIGYMDESVKWLEIAEKMPGYKPEKLIIYKDASAAHKNVGGGYFAQGAFDMALTHFQRRLELLEKYRKVMENPDEYNTVYTLAVAYCDIALAYEKMGDMVNANRSYADCNGVIDKLRGYPEYSGNMDKYYRTF